MGAVFGFHFIIAKEMKSGQFTTARMSCCDMVLLLKIDLTQSADRPFRLPWLCREDSLSHAKGNQVL